jgi:PAS domain S-box-containing protein
VNVNRILAHRTGFIFLLIFIILSLGILTAGYFTYKQYKQNFRMEVEKQLASVAELKVNEIVGWRKGRIGDGEFLFENNLFSTLVKQYFVNKNDEDTKGKIQTWMSHLEKAGNYDQVMLLDMQFTKMIVVPGKKERIQSFIEEGIKEVVRSGKITFQDFYFNEQNQHIYLKVLVPILDEDNKNRVIGIIVLRIDPEKYLYPMIKKWPVPSKTAETLIIRKDSNDALFLNNLRFNNKAALNLRIPLNSLNVPAVKAAKGVVGIVEGIDYRGVKVIADVCHVPDSPWFLVARMDVSEVFEPVTERLKMIIFIVCVLLLGSGTGIGLIWRQQKIKFYEGQLLSAKRIRKLNRVYVVLSEINKAIVRAHDLTTLFNEVCHIAVEKGSFPLAIIGLLDNSTGFLNIAAVMGNSGGYLDKIKISIKEEPSVFCPINNTLLEGKHFTCNNVERDNPVAPCQKKVLELGYRSISSFPLKVFGNIRGVVCLYSEETDFFDEAEIKLLDEMVMDISFAMEFAEKEQERKQAEEALTASETRYHRLFEAARDGILILDSETGIIIDVNSFLLEMLGYSYQELCGKYLWELGFLKDIVANKEKYIQLLQNDYVRYDDLPLESSYGLRFDVEFVSNVYFENQKSIVQCNIRDITERKKAEKKLQEKEEQYRTIFENAQIGIYRTTPDGHILAANPVLVKMLGYNSLEDLIKRNLEEEGFEPEYPRGEFKKIIESKGEINGMEAAWKKTDGTDVFVRENAKVIRGNDGEVKFYEGTVEDITDRRQAENNEKLAHEILESLNKYENSESMIKEIVQSIKKSTGIEAVGIRLKEGDDFPYFYTSGLPEEFVRVENYLCNYDKEGNIIRENDGNAILDCMCGNILRSRVDSTKSFFTEGGSFRSNSTTQLLTTTSKEDRLARTRNRCNSAGYESVALVPIRSGDRILGLLQLNDHRKDMFKKEMIPFFERLCSSIGLAIKRNQVIQEIFKLNEELERRVTQRTTELQTANKELEAFNSSVSHDLRAPLRTISGFARILVEDYSASLNTEAQRLLGVMITSANNMGRLIDDLLMFSRLGKQEITTSEINMYEMANSVFNELVPVQDKDKINFKVLPIPDAYGDPSMIRQVWRNLIGNAIKYSSTKSNPVIEIGTTKSETENIYYVNDNGVGFSMEFVHKLFGVFQRLHNVSEFEGTGIGLANVRQIINRHGGCVWAEGKIDEGAVFHFTLPIERSIT